MWGDDVCPDIDVKRLLLAHLHIIGWKGGCLFPSKEELANPPINGVYQTCMDEPGLLAVLGKLFVDVLKRDDKLGSHTARKSGYLLGLLRGAPSLLSLMTAADHISIKVAMRCLRDAEAMLNVNRVFNDPKQQVGAWRSPHCAGDENAARSAAPGSQFQKPLPDIVKGFIQQRVGIHPQHPKAREVSYVYQQVVAWRKAGNNPTQDLQVRLCNGDGSAL